MIETFSLKFNSQQLNAVYTHPQALKIAATQSGFTSLYRAGQHDKLRNVASAKYRHHWQKRWGQGVYNLPEDAVCTEIGGGVGVNAIWSAQYLPSSRWHLVDSEEPNIDCETSNWDNFTEDGSVQYNSRDVSINGILSSGLDRSRFTYNTLGQNPWPKSDMIMSAYSWCFHYPTEVYFDKVMESLKPGGLLWISVRINDADDTISKISSALGVSPILQNIYDRETRPSDIPKLTNYSASEYWLAECLWKRPM